MLPMHGQNWENGFDLTDYDKRTLDFARDYSNELLAIDVNIGITQMLDTAWALFRKYFTRSELGNQERDRGRIRKYGLICGLR